MTIVAMVDAIVKWLNDEVCPEIRMKRPPGDREQGGIDYAYELVNPVAYPMYVPTKDRLPPGAHSFPSVCVIVKEGKDTMDKDRVLDVSLSLGAWNPGVHPGDWLDGTDGQESEHKGSYLNLAEGWRDLWNFADAVIAALESRMYLNGVEIMKNEPVVYGPYTEDGAIIPTYPYWFAHVDFKARTTLIRNNIDSMEYL